MDDLTITRLCAAAMGFRAGRLAKEIVCYFVEPCAIIASNAQGGESVYDPLHDDAQAMALVKRFRLFINHSRQDDTPYWKIALPGHGIIRCDPNLNRAICLAVATMQERKK